MSEHLVVQIDTGKIRGKAQKDYHGGKFYRFSGIPYAKAPVGNLRFKAPEPAEPWEGIRDGTKEGPECPAVVPVVNTFVGKENNCLSLNIYTKQLPKDNNAIRKPVMVFIHGGGFICGSNKQQIYGPRYLLTEDIVLVVINYRLGVLGFLSLKDPSLNVPGNAGLKDQVLALKWIQRNIHNFGGDVDNVTIFGESAGSASVHLLILSPLSKGLFHKAILQSGVAINPWVMGKENGADIAKLIGCEANIDEKVLLEKLTRMNVKSLVKAQFKISDPLFASIVRPFGPVVEYSHEGAFLSTDPLEIMKTGRFCQIPMIIGYMSLEGLIYEMMRRTRADAKLPETLEKDIPHRLKIPPESETARKVAEEMKQFYFKDNDLSMKNISTRYIMFGDIQFLHGIHRTVGLHKIHGTSPIYVYKINVQSTLNFLTRSCQAKHYRLAMIFSVFSSLSQTTSLKKLFQNLQERLIIKEFGGIGHGDDIFYLFSNIVTPIVKGSKEDFYVKRFVKLWTNFAKYGNPTPESTEIFNNVTWNEVNDEAISDILQIDKTLYMTGNAEKERLKFLENLFQRYES